jgi:O-antigen ligase
LITAQDIAQDIAISRAAPPIVPAVPVPATAFSERLLLVVLYVTVLASSVAFVEPSPHDALMGVLALACLIAGVRFERPVALLFLLLLIWNVAGLLSLLNVPGQEQTVQYAGTSIYLAVAAMIFAGLFSQNTLPRLATMRAAYILSALLTTVFGLAVYFHFLPGEDTFMWAGRLRSTFKDPNVFGPFLILPALFLIEDMVTRRIQLWKIAATLIMLAGILFSFSRGAWFNYAVSAVVLLVLIFCTAPTPSARMRPIVLAVVSAVGLALLLVALLSFESVRAMLLERAQLTQSYDVGEGGRFGLQGVALGLLLDKPFGFGPFEFSRMHGGTQQHNVYLQAFLVYGWAGGISYIMLILTTLFVGLRNVLLRTPWQSYLIATYAAFVGILCESFIIDSDHWRHFFLILGIIWGLSAANGKFMRGERQAAFSATPVSA